MARKVLRKSTSKKSVTVEEDNLTTSLVTSIRKACGADSAVTLSGYEDTVTSKPVAWIKSGLRWLDYAISEGKGWPSGKVIEIFGPEAVGKTALCQYLIKQYQKQGGTAVYLDYETALDPINLESYGIDLSSLIYASVETVEDGFNAVMSVIKELESKAKKDQPTKPVLIVWDSIAMSTPAAEASEAAHGDQHIGLLARALSKGMRKIRRRIAKVNCTLLFTNQIRDKIGVRFGDKTDTPGGRAVKFTASIRIKNSRIKTLFVTRSGQKIPAGYNIECDIKKTRFASPHQKARFFLSFDCGVDPVQSFIDYLLFRGLVRKSGKQMIFVPTDTEFKRKEWKEFYRANRKAVELALVEQERKCLCVSTDDAEAESEADDS